MVVAVTAVQVGVSGDQVRALGGSGDVRYRRFPPCVIHITHKKGAGTSAVDPGDVPLQVLPVEVQARSPDAHPHRRARSVVVIPDVRRARLLELHQAPFQRVLRRYTVHGLRSTVSVRIIAVTDGIGPVRGSRELSSLLPGGAPAVIVCKGVPGIVVADRLVIILRQLVLPVGIPVSVALYRRSDPRKGFPGLVRLFLRFLEIPAPVIAVNDGLVEVLVVLPGQPVQIVVMISYLFCASLRYGLAVS